MKSRPQRRTQGEQAEDLKYHALFELAADMIWLGALDEQARIIDAKTAAVRQLGESRRDVIGRPVYDFYFSEEDRARARKFARTVLESGSGSFLATFRNRFGAPLEAELRGSLIDYQGRKAVLTVARDMSTHLKEHRRALALYEAFKRSNDVMCYCDRNAVIVDVNEAFTGHYGYSREEAVGRTPRILRSRHSTDELYRRMWASLLDPQKAYWRGQMINKAKDGREVPVILMITAVRDDAGEIIGYMSNAVDMTEQVALQARVADSEALATIGEMAAVVAHEIRNPLGSVVMAAKQLAGEPLSAQDRETVLKVLRAESQRLSETLTNFLAFARPHEIRFQRASLNSLVEEVCRAVRSNPALVKAIKVEAALTRGLAPFPMDPDQVRQVIWNIVINAIQAMEGKGVLSVETGREGRQAFLRVKDTGPGIPPSALASIFKPFHTTKQQGTGLGLAIAERIVKAHGGRIEVESRGQGAAFTVHLPCVED